MSDYEKILLPTRLRDSTIPGRTIVTESESDRGRILFCAAFRRLQQKAQVFSMEPNAAVRSRLTHSFEVSQIGRYLADEVSARLISAKLMTAQQQSALVNFVEAACLMHDIGNPPFGHFGEAAITKWFSDNGEECLRISTNRPKPKMGTCPQQVKINSTLADFFEFDGNPQGLRIVTRLQWNNDEYGLNLTKSALASFMKYVRMAGVGGAGLFTKKAGYFSTEQEIVADVWKEFGYKLQNPRRFPLAYLMEAADDIAYCVSDLEDSFEKGIVNLKPALEEIKIKYLECGFNDLSPKHAEILQSINWLIDGYRNGKKYTYTDFRTSINNAIVKYVAERYFTHHQSIIDGKLDSLIPESQPPGAILDVLKKFCRKHVYIHESVQRVELAGYNAIRGLLEQCEPLLSISASRFNFALNNEKKDEHGVAIVLESKLLSLFPKNYIRVYQHHVESAEVDGKLDALKEWNFRAHLVVDFISGMTDDFAMTTYRTLAGMRL